MKDSLYFSQNARCPTGVRNRISMNCCLKNYISALLLRDPVHSIWTKISMNILLDLVITPWIGFWVFLKIQNCCHYGITKSTNSHILKRIQVRDYFSRPVFSRAGLFIFVKKYCVIWVCPLCDR